MYVKGGFFNGDEMPFCEDIYLLDSDGESFACREAKEGKKFSLYDILEQGEIAFISDNRCYISEHKLLLVIGRKCRPILVDCIFYSRYRILTAIVPHFKLGVLKSLIEEGLGAHLIISPGASAALAACKKLRVSRPEREFGQRISDSHPVSSVYDMDNMSNRELAETILAMTYHYSQLYGCGVNVATTWDGEFDMNSYFSPHAYAFVLAALCLIARKCSEDQSMNISIGFSNVGVYCDFGFRWAKEFRKKQNPEKRIFGRFNAICFLCGIYISCIKSAETSGCVGFRFSPIKNIPESSDIKQTIKKLKY